MRSRTPLIIFLLFAILALSQAVGDSMREEKREKRACLMGRNITLDVSLADTSPKLRKGLGGSPPLPRGNGMLLVFQEADRHGIWMKDMRFSLDILWLSEERLSEAGADEVPLTRWGEVGRSTASAPALRVEEMAERVSPETFPRVFYPHTPSRYVLEVPAGSSEDMGISPGDTFRLLPPENCLVTERSPSAAG